MLDPIFIILSPNSTACNTQTNTVIRREINKNKFRVLGVLRWQSHFFAIIPPGPQEKKIRAKGWSLTSEKFPAIIDVINLWGRVRPGRQGFCQLEKCNYIFYVYFKQLLSRGSYHTHTHVVGMENISFKTTKHC